MRLILALAFVIAFLGCDVKCPKGQVKIDGKCYIPGQTYYEVV